MTDRRGAAHHELVLVNQLVQVPHPAASVYLTSRIGPLMLISSLNLTPLAPDGCICQDLASDKRRWEAALSKQALCTQLQL